MQKVDLKKKGFKQKIAQKQKRNHKEIFYFWLFFKIEFFGLLN